MSAANLSVGIASQTETGFDEHYGTGCCCFAYPAVSTGRFARWLRSGGKTCIEPTTDQRGRYQFAGVAPDKFRLFEWDDVTLNAWYDPHFLNDQKKQAEEAGLSPKAKANIGLTSELRRKRGDERPKCANLLVDD